jgi:hypothetical protein
METTLYSVVTCLENGIEHKKILLGPFPDIEGASYAVFSCQKI